MTLPQGGFRFGGGDAGGTSTTTTTPSRPRPQLTPAEQQARQACASLRPQGGFGSGRGGFDRNNPAFAKFQACLKQHGVQTGSGQRGGFSQASRTAFQACRSLLPPGAGGGFGGGAGGGGAPGANPAFQRFQACLRQHRVQPGGGQSSSKTAAAIAACRSVLPNGGNGSGATTTTTG